MIQRAGARAVLLAAALVVAALLAGAGAQAAGVLAVEGTTRADGRVTLEWPPLRGGRAEIFRRDLGAQGRETWRPVETLARGFRASAEVGVGGAAQEFLIGVTRPARDGRLEPPRIGVWVTGREVPARADQGVALLVVDATQADALAGPLEQFQSDLTGAGWQVRRHDAPRAAEDPAENLRLAAALRDWVRAEYRAAPDRTHAVILLGHLPVVRTGRVNPDGHDPHAVPSDLYYADADGAWPQTTAPDGKPQLLPSTLPGLVEMQVGRIDFAGLGPQFGAETALLADYLARNHRWRMGEEGDPRTAYGADPNLLVERAALDNIVGPTAVRAAGHKDAAGHGPYLVGVDFGHWNGADYVDLPPAEAIFAINFGSGKHRFDAGNNAMTALLARGAALAVGWGGRPAWQLNGLAMGDSIGQVHLRSVNNGLAAGGLVSRDYPSTGLYEWVGAPWVNLLGDPTLRPFPLPPVADAQATAGTDGLRLDWTLPPAAAGARVFRAPARQGPYQPLGDGPLVTGGGVTDPAPLPGGWYMIRAEGLAEVHAGSFWRLAQGVFVPAP